MISAKTMNTSRLSHLVVAGSLAGGGLVFSETALVIVVLTCAGFWVDDFPLVDCLFFFLAISTTMLLNLDL